MKTAGVYEAKTHLSALLKKVKKGETIIISSHNKPVAQLRPVESKRLKKRPIGLEKGTFTVPDDFNDPLPNDIIDAFEGKYST